MSGLSSMAQDPCVRDRITYQFTKVVDGLSEYRGNTQVMCPLPPILHAQILGIIHTCQVEQGVLVVWPIVRFHLVIFRCDEVIASIDQHLHRINLVE